MSFDSMAKDALQAINFSKRFQELCLEFYKEKGIDKPDKKEILQSLKSLGYDFKYTDRCFIFIEYWKQDIKSHTVLNLKYGICLAYFNIAVDEKYIDLNSGNFGTMAYALDKDIEAPGMPTFASYQEFKEIAERILIIYEDFKKEFLNIVENKSKV